MKKRRTGIPRLFVILSLALAGLMTLQVLLLNYAWDMKKQAFDRGVQSALAATVLALESREIEGSAYEYFFATNDSNGVSNLRIEMQGEPNREVMMIRELHTTTTRDFYAEPSLQRLFPERYKLAFPDSVVVAVAPNALTVAPAGVIELQNNQRVALRNVLGDWMSQAPPPIAERLDEAEIAEVLHNELANVGINATPRYGVLQPARRVLFEVDANSHGYRRAGQNTNGQSDEVVLASDDITDAELLASPYKHQLFPLDPFSAPYDLVAVFPEENIYLLWQMWPLWLSSILFITVIIFSFFKSWRTNAEQRRFADQLVDFINNMTHEFKTPISTVGLAGEAIRRDDVRNQPEILERYVGMIRDENERMHRQVEKILQMARFERGDIELKHEAIAVHDLLHAVTDSFVLKIEQRGGKLEKVLAAGQQLVHGDRVHLESIFSNLVDNAVKYSPDAPLVKVGTDLDDGFLVVKVTDQGKGIARENQRRVFEKYYRCPTGNRHDVKGYGLGLSFVRSLVTAHGGYVELHSLPGQGTTVTVSLPLAKDQSEVE